MAITALHTAATAMDALSTKIDVIANNIANAGTVAFKSSRANFQDLLYQVQAQPGVQTADSAIGTPLGTQIGLGVAVSNTQVSFRQGSPQSTGNPLDVMINGDGFFKVELPGGGTGYTRAGNFVRNADGDLVLGNSVGHLLQDAPTIPTDVPADSIGISSDGQVMVTIDGTSQSLGQLQLVRFPNAAGLLQHGDNIFLASAASGDPIEGTAGQDGIGTLSAGMLELSNTSAVTELVELIKTQRVFQMNSQTIQSADETLQVVANLRR
ncbi:MAG: flagellar basal-body rod protein FlgG [Planctomycetes bacterium]|nr:flagellar basal-body rod protein FlgG [Planctomycetota bacterium]